MKLMYFSGFEFYFFDLLVDAGNNGFQHVLPTRNFYIARQVAGDEPRLITITSISTQVMAMVALSLKKPCSQKDNIIGG